MIETHFSFRFDSINMSQHRTRLLPRKIKKQEQELRIIANPIIRSTKNLLNDDDYQAPLTANSLRPNSKWIIVRNNIHKIRSWGKIDTSHIDERMRDWYLVYQMRRELRRAQEDIKQIEERSSFTPVNYFNLPISPTRVERFNVSDVRSTAVLYYPSVGNDPIVLQALLYYFSKECAVPYESVFRSFLGDVCLILSRERKQIHRATIFRRIVLTFSIIICIIIGIMLIGALLSVLTTTSNLRAMYQNDPDGGFEWRQRPTTLQTNLDYL